MVELLGNEITFSDFFYNFPSYTIVNFFFIKGEQGF